MISTQEAFKKFRSRLELNQREQQDASRRQQRIRAVMDEAFAIEADFLTGSYRRWTKAKPLKDVDIFCVLGQKERPYREKAPAVLLADVEAALIDEYGKEHVACQRRSVTVNCGVVEVDGETNDQGMSFDVVPALTTGDHYAIPDTAVSSGWTETNPKIHTEKAVKAQEAYAGAWQGLVRMRQAWNRQQGKPIKPSLLLAVMALEMLHPPFGGDYRRERPALFASTAASMGEAWPDPAGLGPPGSDSMDAQQRAAARRALCTAEKQAAKAIRLERAGKNGAALRAWGALCGPRCPLSSEQGRPGATLWRIRDKRD